MFQIFIPSNVRAMYDCIFCSQSFINIEKDPQYRIETSIVLLK